MFGPRTCKSCDLRGLLLPNTHAYRLLIFKERLLIRYQHRGEIMSRFHCLVKHLGKHSCLPASAAAFAWRSHRCLTRQSSQARFATANRRHSPCREAKAPAKQGLLVCISSLTMSYFHTGIRTIIGAESFHCPVRDGKEWDQLAMVIRLKLFTTPGSWARCSSFAESISILDCVT